MSEALYKALLTAFEEDRNMITAQSAAIDADPDAPMLPLAMDAAVIRFRRMVEQMATAERVDTPQTAAKAALAAAKN